MTIKTELRTIDISLRLWRGGWSAGYEPDCFSDLEVNFSIDHPERAENDDFAIVATEKDASELIEWWENECKTVNAGNVGDVLQSLTDEEIANGDEWVLIVE